jgi:hypoxanthine phosphoribosyltransferase
LQHEISEIVISAEHIAGAVDRLARQIDGDLRGAPALLVGVLKGSVFFLCDLARRMRSPVVLDFLQVSSYGGGTRSSGDVRMISDLSIDVAGRHVIVVEDIVDSGGTLAKIRGMLSARGPASLRVCALLRKSVAGAAAIPVEYLGFEIDDRFVVGYGLDLAERFRNLPYVAALKKEGGV